MSKPAVTVELYGVPRARAGRKELVVPATTAGEALAALLEAASFTEADLNALLAGQRVPPKLNDPDDVPEPPGEPVTRTGLPSLSRMLGVIDDNGRLPGPGALASAPTSP